MPKLEHDLARPDVRRRLASLVVIVGHSRQNGEKDRIVSLFVAAMRRGEAVTVIRGRMTASDIASIKFQSAESDSGRVNIIRVVTSIDPFTEKLANVIVRVTRSAISTSIATNRK